jgi:hypothetical protein
VPKSDLYLQEAARLKEMAAVAVFTEAREEFLKVARQYELLSQQAAASETRAKQAIAQN